MADRRFGFLIAGLVFLADQLSKWIVTGPLGVDQLGDQIVLLPIFNLTYTQNFGISLGMMQASSETGRWALVAMTAAIAGGVAFWMGREKARIDQLALGMVLGGALGNIVDRVREGFVTDFLDLHFGTFRPFYIFNVADAAISIAVVMLLLRAFVTSKGKETGPEPKETTDHA